MEKSIPHIGKKPSPLSPYLLHLYQRNGCINETEKDALTITEDEVVYKLRPDVELTEVGTEESLNALAVHEPPPLAPTLEARRTATQPRTRAGPSKEPHWRDIDLSSFEYLETPFKRVWEELAHLQNHYFRLEHITRGMSMALDNCGPGNILRELA